MPSLPIIARLNNITLSTATMYQYNMYMYLYDTANTGIVLI